MSEFLIACGSCFLAGFLTTIHPCPLATNIASISFLSGLTTNRNRIAYVTFFFVCGYFISYSVVGMVISSGFLSIPVISIKLQKSISLILGPVLILLGMIQSDLFNLQKFYKGRIINYLQSRKWSGIEVFPFGVLIALSFCPATAAIFFGILIPLAVRFDQMVLFPLIYSFGASLPVVVISLMISQGTLISSKAGWIRVVPVITGWILIIIGIYISIKRIYLV